MLLKRNGIVLLVSIFLSASLLAAETASRGTKGVTEEEFTPAQEVLSVKYVHMGKSNRVDLKSLKGVFKKTMGVKIALQKQDKAFPNGGGSVCGAEVKAIHDGFTIYFQITWSDPTKDIRTIAVQDFKDAAALMFPLGAVEITPADHFSPRMGDREKPVNIWHWKADWAEDLYDKNKLVGVEVQYPNLEDDFYSNPYLSDHLHELITSSEMLSGGCAANNLLSQPARGRTVEDLNAEGFGTLTTQEHQDVNGYSQYKNGVWTVIMYRSLTTSDRDDVQFVPGGQSYFNVAIWNGSEKDRNGQKNISVQWHPITLE